MCVLKLLYPSLFQARGYAHLVTVMQTGISLGGELFDGALLKCMQ
jgi:hypothetical protein